MVLKKEITIQIKDFLQKNPQGLSITDIVSEVNINRNTAGRYLENLLVSGQVDMRRLGMAKIYRLSQRVPLSAVLSISSELVIQLDSSLRIIFANEPFLKLVGTDSKDLFGKNIEYTSVGLVFDEAFTGFIETIRQGVAGKEWSGEIELGKKDIIVFCRIAPTVFDDGRKGVSVILEDITQRKQAEQKVEESERQFRLLAENSLDMIGRIKPDFTHIYVSPAYTTTLGYLPEEIIGKRGQLFIHPEDVHIIKSVENILTPQNPSTTIRFRVKHKDGHYIWIESTVKAIFDEKTRELSEYYVVTRDITERKTAVDALRESEDRYRKLVEISPDAVLLHKEGKVIYANPATFKLLGASHSDEIVGKYVLDFIPVGFKDIVRKNVQKDLDGQTSPNIELPMIRIDGTPILIEGRGIGTIIDGKPAVQVAIRDITEQKRAEEALRKSEDLYRTLAEASNDLIFVIGRDDRVEYVNSYASSMVNKTADRIIGQPRSSLFPPELARNQKKALEKVFETGIPVRNEGALTFAGRTHWFDHNLTPLKDADERVRSVLGISRDITERKQVENALHESEEKYRSFIERANDGIGVIQDQTIKMCNDRLAVFWGGSPEQILGMNIKDLIHPDALSEVIDRYNRRMAGETSLPIYETIFKNKDGSRFYAELNAGIISYEGQPADLIIVRDINDRKKAEDSMRESEERLRLILNSTDDLIFMQDLEGRYLYFNSAARYGVSVGEMLGRTPHDFLEREPADRIVKRLKTIVKTGQIIKEETPLVWKGETLWFSDNLSPVRDGNGTIIAVVTISHNITERKRAEMALRESEATSRALMNAPTDSVILMDITGIILALNETAAKRFGKRSEELVDIQADDLLPEEVARSRRTLIAQVLETRKMVRFEDERDGCWYDTVAYPVVSGTGEITRIAIIARDITDRKRSEQALIQSEQRFRNLITAMGDIVWETDAQSRFVYISPQVETILGYKPDELIGHFPFEFLHPDAIGLNHEKFQSAVEKHEKSVLHVSHWIHKEGRDVFLESKAIPLFDSTGSFSGFIGIDRKR